MVDALASALPLATKGGVRVKIKFRVDNPRWGGEGTEYLAGEHEVENASEALVRCAVAAEAADGGVVVLEMDHEAKAAAKGHVEDDAVSLKHLEAAEREAAKAAAEEQEAALEAAGEVK